MCVNCQFHSSLRSRRIHWRVKLSQHTVLTVLSETLYLRYWTYFRRLKFSIFFSLQWLLLNVREASLLCYLTHNWQGRGEETDSCFAFASSEFEHDLQILLFTPISAKLPARIFFLYHYLHPVQVPRAIQDRRLQSKEYSLCEYVANMLSLDLNRERLQWSRKHLFGSRFHKTGVRHYVKQKLYVIWIYFTNNFNNWKSE